MVVSADGKTLNAYDKADKNKVQQRLQRLKVTT
jgi:hypothetical protein